MPSSFNPDCVRKPFGALSIARGADRRFKSLICMGDRVRCTHSESFAERETSRLRRIDHPIIDLQHAQGTWLTGRC